MIVWLLVCALTGNVLVYSPECRQVADYNAAVGAALMGLDFTLVPDTSTARLPDSGNLVYIGTPWGAYYRQHLRDILPFRFSGDTVFVADTMLVAEDFVLDCQFPQPDGPAVSATIGRDPRTAAAGINRGDHDFALARQRDGTEAADATCLGRFQWQGNRLLTIDVTWQRQPVRPLRLATGDHVRLYCDSTQFASGEQARLLRLLEVEYDGYTQLYGVKMPETVSVYGYNDTNLARTEAVYDVPFGIIWHKRLAPDAVAHPRTALSLAHELAHVAFQGLTDRNPLRRGCEDWGDYAPLIAIMPYVRQVLGDSAWPARLDSAARGRGFFTQLYRGAPHTYAALLEEADRRFGKIVIGRAVNEVLPVRWVRLGDMEQFMAALGRLSGDSGFARRVAAGYPSPLSYRLSGDLGWQDFGFSPNLDAMSLAGRFVIDSVAAGGAADSAGLHAGDTLVSIDGHDLATARDDCWRELVRKRPGDMLTVTVRGRARRISLTVRRTGQR